MYRLYEKSRLWFALVWIFAYVILFTVADDLSPELGMGKVLTLPVAVVFVVLLIAFLRTHGLTDAFGLCPIHGRAATYLYFVPLLVLISVNLWQGVYLTTSMPEAILAVATMICVGFIEELIFRAFLFTALLQDNAKMAIIVSSVTFGLGHIVNVLRGASVVATLLQIASAIALGFLFTVIFYRSGSLWPCIIAHSSINSLSVFTPESLTLGYGIFVTIVVCAICIAYSLWILRRVPRAQTVRSAA